MAKWIMDHISLDELKKEGKYPFSCAAFDHLTDGDRWNLWENIEQFYSGDYNYYEELADKTGWDSEHARERVDNPDLYFENDYLFAWLINEGVEDTIREKCGTVENVENLKSEDIYDLIDFDSKASDFFDEFYYECVKDGCIRLGQRSDDDDDDDYEDLDESIIVKRAFEKLKEHNAKSEVRKIVESVFSSKLAEQK